MSEAVWRSACRYAMSRTLADKLAQLHGICGAEVVPDRA
jgi:hypothetical protein